MSGVGFFIAALSLAAVPQDAGDEERAREYLERAEELASQGRYRAAWNKYLNAMVKYPETEAGRIARRRIGEGSGYLGYAYLVQTGPSRNRVDVCILGDGFKLESQESFDRLADDVPGLFAREDTFREYLDYFNFLRVNLFSKDTGIELSTREKNTALRGRSGGRSGRTRVSNQRVFQWLDELPEDDGLAIVFVPSGSRGYGGNGVVTVGGRADERIFHDFGAAFAGLASESSNSNDGRGDVREAPNLSASKIPEMVPWRHWLEAGARDVGIYRGGNGSASGTFKPNVQDCHMSRGNEYCRVCREAVVLAIYRWVDPIDEVLEPTPHEFPFRNDASPLRLGEDQELVFRVRVMQPRSHRLEVRWYLVDAARAPAPPRGPRRNAIGARDSRGALRPIQAEPLAETRPDRRGIHTLKLEYRDLRPGNWRLICRVRDTTEFRGERWPWVLADPRGLLESERGWWIVVEP